MLTIEEEKLLLSAPILALSNRKIEMRKYDLKMSPSHQQLFKTILSRYMAMNANREHLANGVGIYPKIIHQLWIGPNPVPMDWINTWAIDYVKANPEWEHRLWNDKMLNDLHMYNKDLFLKEKTYNGKSDIARYEILYKFGGIYIDADSIWLETKSLNQLMTPETGLFVGIEPGKDYAASGVVWATKGHPALLLIMNAIKRNIRVANTFQAWITMGPLVLHVLENNGVPVTRYPDYFFYPENWHSKRFIDIPEDKKEKFRKNSYMYQFGYTTNNLQTFFKK